MTILDDRIRCRRLAAQREVKQLAIDILILVNNEDKLIKVNKIKSIELLNAAMLPYLEILNPPDESRSDETP
jgi:hypothetical protein